MQIFSNSEGMPMPNIVSPDGTATAEGKKCEMGDRVLEGDGVKGPVPSSFHQSTLVSEILGHAALDGLHLDF